MKLLKVFLDDLLVRLKAHMGLANAHHEPYTDAEVDAIVAVHTAIANAHHEPYTDAEVDAIVAVHAAIGDAHHAKYTDAEAVAAADASDKFIERNVVNDVIDTTTINRNDYGYLLHLRITLPATYFILEPLLMIVKSTTVGRQAMYIDAKFPYFTAQGNADAQPYGEGFISLLKAAGSWATSLKFYVMNSTDHARCVLELSDESISVHNRPIRDIKNDVDATLSGTPRIIELSIGGVPYYFKVYPTKT